MFVLKTLVDGECVPNIEMFVNRHNFDTTEKLQCQGLNVGVGKLWKDIVEKSQSKPREFKIIILFRSESFIF